MTPYIALQCLVIVNVIFAILETLSGIGRHIAVLTASQLEQAFKYNFIGDPFGIIGVALPKLAVVIFIHKIIGQSYRTLIWALYALVVANLVFSALDSILLFVQCSPPSASWDSSVPHTCWDPSIVSNYSYFVGGLYFPQSCYSADPRGRILCPLRSRPCPVPHSNCARAPNAPPEEDLDCISHGIWSLVCATTVIGLQKLKIA